MKPHLLLPLLLAAACDKDEKPEDTGSDTDTGGDTAEPIAYEEGCITVDGEGGYKWLNDAIDVAEEGATIELCEGEYEEAVVVSKAVSIVGAGSALTLWNAPTNQAAFSIEPAEGASSLSGVGLNGVGITSTRSGIEVEAAQNVTLTDIHANAVANYGISCEDAQVTISDSLFEANEWGAVLADGGQVTVLDSVFTGNISFGVKAEAGAEIAVQGSSFTGTLYTDHGDGSVDDGFPIFGDEGGGIALSGNSFADNEILSVYAANSGPVTMDGDQIRGGQYGIFQAYGDLSLTDVRIVDATEFGVYYVAPAGGTLLAEGLEVSGDPEVVGNYSLNTNNPSSVGVLAQGNDITIRNSTINGYNDFGMHLSSYDSGAGALLLESVTMRENGRVGVWAYDLDITADDVHISGLRNIDEQGGPEYDVVNPGAFVAYESTLTWTGGSLIDNEGWGISATLANADVQGASFSGNSFSSYIDLQSATQLSGNSFVNSVSGDLAAVWLYESAGAVLQGNSFSDNDLGEVVYDYTEKYGYKYVYFDRGTDIISNGGSLVAYENSFADGGDAITLLWADAEIRDNSFQDYNGSILTVYEKANDAVVFEDNSVDGWGGYLVYASYYYDTTNAAEVEVSGLEARNGGLSETSYEYWLKGKLYSSTTYSSTYYGFYMSYATMLLEDVLVEDSVSHPVRGYDASIELDDVSFRNVSTGMTYYSPIYLYWSSSAVEFTADDLLIESPGYGHGMELYRYNSVDVNVFDISGLTITDAPSYGMYLYDLDDIVIADAAISGSGSYGAYLYGTTGELEELDLSANGSDGLYASSSDLSITASDSSANGGAGMTISGGGLELTDSVLSDNTGSGLVLQSAIATVTGNEITGNQAYGMSCSGTAFDSCDNTVTDNVLGDIDGCDASCAGE